MQEYVHNFDNLSEKDITETVIRVKALLIHKNNIILGYERGIYQFPGGHLEENETFIECIKREVMEETGIILKDEQIDKPIYKISHLNKDWPSIGNNRKSEIYYYVIKTDDKPNLSNTHYTENEMLGNFSLEEIPINEVIQKLTDNISKNDKNKAITPDMIRVIEEYKKKEGII